ncbi:hypothetical protein AB0M12_26275 [Nocardia vinacea]|uniref:hypothetical protein n=1 Tax=Nocardia vinacea TaxID=96468 RepID=UPI00341507D7
MAAIASTTTPTPSPDDQLAAVPITRHDWHSDWYYTIGPEPAQPTVSAEDLAGPARADTAWLRSPELTGLTAPRWGPLIEKLGVIRHAQPNSKHGPIVLGLRRGRARPPHATQEVGTTSRSDSSSGERRACSLIRSTLDNLPAFANVNTIGALGYQSIGDAASGYEHYINSNYVRDDRFLDATRPESLVYQVDGPNRTLVSAMYIARDMGITDPELVDFGGPMMQWHVHDNLCWRSTTAGPRVAGIADAAGSCPRGSVNPGASYPMVHVWIVANKCGPFAALEGHGTGQTAPSPDGRRADMYTHDHSTGQRWGGRCTVGLVDLFDPAVEVGAASLSHQLREIAQHRAIRLGHST